MFTYESVMDMSMPNGKLANLITQLHTRTNETKEVFDRALIELEQAKADLDRQVKQLKEERRKWDEEQNIINALLASANPIVHLNVGGEKMSTTRATLTLIEGSLLAKMFSGKWDVKLPKDANGHIFLDYDPTVSDGTIVYLILVFIYSYSNIFSINFVLGQIQLSDVFFVYRWDLNNHS